MKFIFLLIISISVGTLSGQSLERWAISAAGHSRISPTFHLDGTAGEPVIGFAENSSYILSIGFQQGSKGSTGINDPIAKYNLRVYPVPTSDNLAIVMDIPDSREVTISIYDMLGQRIFLDQNNISKNFRKEVNMSNLPSGTYSLFIQIPEEEPITIKIQKIN